MENKGDQHRHTAARPGIAGKPASLFHEGGERRTLNRFGKTRNATAQLPAWPIGKG